MMWRRIASPRCSFILNGRREEEGGRKEEGVRQPFAATVNYVLMPAIFHAPDERTAGRILRLASVVSSHQGRRKRRGKRDKLLEKTSSFPPPLNPPSPKRARTGCLAIFKAGRTNGRITINLLSARLKATSDDSEIKHYSSTPFTSTRNW